MFHLTEEAIYLRDYFNTWFKSLFKKVSNFDDFKQKISGYLILNIQESVQKRKLIKNHYNNDDVYIISGIYILTFAKDILNSKTILISGLLLEKYNDKQIFYLRHVLSSLKFNSFSFSVCTLIKSISEADYDKIL